MKWLKSFFNRWRDKRDRKRIANVTAPLKSERVWGLVRPHTQKSQGAVGRVSEYAYWLSMWEKLANSNIPFTNRNQGGLKGAYTRLAKKGVTASVESHKNAFNKQAKGYEVLIIDGDAVSRKYAKKYIELMKSHFPSRVNRGIKTVKNGQRGYANLIAAKNAGIKIALLTEDFFIDNRREWIEPRLLAKVYDELLKS